MALARVITCRGCNTPIVMNGFCRTLLVYSHDYYCSRCWSGRREEQTIGPRDDEFHPRRFATLSEWYAIVFRRGVPTAVPDGIQRTMVGLDIGFHAAFDLLIAEHELMPAGTGYIIDLAGPEKVIEKHRRR